MICRTCPATLGPKNKSGFCRSCLARSLNADPAMVAKRKAAQAVYHARPEVKQGCRDRLATYLANMPESDRKRRAERGKWLAAHVLSRPDVVAATLAPETRRRAGQSRTETLLAWCPPEKRDAYRALTRGGNVSAAEARRMIEAEIPGTVEHARRQIHNVTVAQRIRAEREKAQAY